LLYKSVTQQALNSYSTAGNKKIVNLQS
jgi:hypothetical protein